MWFTLFMALYGPMIDKIRDVAIKAEIMDVRESMYILNRPNAVWGSFLLSDLKLIISRARQYQTAPPLSDSLSLPDRETVGNLLAFNRAYKARLELLQACYPLLWQEFSEALANNERLYQIWDKVRDARCEYYFVTVRRDALRKLRELIGPEAYYSHNLPSVVH